MIRVFIAWIAATGLSLIALSPAHAHEFWLDSVDYMPKPGARVPILLRNGVDFLGDTYPYLRKWSRRFSVIDARGERVIKTVEGDDPAGEVAFPTAGLATVMFQRAPDTVDYKTAAQFIEVLDDEGLTSIAARYRAQPDAAVPIRESYARYAKALIRVGDGSGSDRPVGLDLEIIMETNPYTVPTGTALVARVLHLGRPAPDVQVKVFVRPKGNDKSIEPRRLRTDAEGRVAIGTLSSGEVLLSAVVMSSAAPPDRDGAVPSRWISLWASLTFQQP